MKDADREVHSGAIWRTWQDSNPRIPSCPEHDLLATIGRLSVALLAEGHAPEGPVRHLLETLRELAPLEGGEAE